MAPKQANSGIVTDEASGQQVIPESTRADGTVRKAIKVRPGYRPAEDVEIYRSRPAENFRNRGKGGVPGAEGLEDSKTPGNGTAGSSALSATSAKNAKRREARRKAKETGNDEDKAALPQTAAAASSKPEEPVDAEAEKEKKARNLKKKLRQARELKDKRDGGEALLPEQIAKVIRINELVRELEALGLKNDDDTQAEGKDSEAKATAKPTG